MDKKNNKYYSKIIKEKLKYNEGQIREIEKLLESLFPEKVTPATENYSLTPDGKKDIRLKINDPRYFKVFLSYRLLNSSISHKKFVDAFYNGYDSLKEAIDNWISNKNIKFDDIERKLIEVVMLNCDDFKTKLLGLRYLYYKNDEADVIESIYKLLKNYESLKDRNCFNEKKDEKKFYEFIEGFLNEKSVDVKVRFNFIINMFLETLKSISAEKRKYEFILPRDRFEQLIMSVFEEYVDKSKHIKKNDWGNFFTMFKQMDDKYKPRVKELMLDLINKDIDKFLCSLISRGSSGNFLTIRFWDELFDSFDEFIKYLKQKNNSRYKQEYIEFLQEAKKESIKYDCPTKFKFKKMKSCIEKKQST